MNETLAQAIGNLWPISARLLGWAPDQFWQATPQELASALSEAAPSPDLTRGPTGGLTGGSGTGSNAGTRHDP